MSSSLVSASILLPLALSLVAAGLGRWPRASALVGVAAAVAMAGLLALATRSAEPATLDLAGRTLTLTAEARGALAAAVVGLLIISLMALARPGPKALIPSALASTALLSAALMIEPFSFGAILALGAVAALMPALVDGRNEAAKSAWRAFLLAGLAVIALILVDWLVATGQAGSTTASVALLVAALPLLAGFPFHIWVGPLARQSRPLAAAVAFGLVYGLLTLFLLIVAEQLPAARSAPAFMTIVRWSAAATALTGAIIMTRARTWTAVAAYALLIDMGCLVLVLLLPGDGARQAAAAGMAARLVGLLLIAAAALWEAGRLWRVAAFLAGCLTLLGLPLTPGYVARWSQLAAAGAGPGGFPWAAAVLLGGLALGMAAALRAALRFDPTDGAGEGDRRLGRWVIAALLALALLLGLFPQLLIEYASRVAGL